MTLKEAIKIELREHWEYAKNPWFWVFYVALLVIAKYFNLFGG